MYFYTFSIKTKGLISIRYFLKVINNRRRMKLVRIFMLVLVLVTMGACGRAERKANKAEADIRNERFRLVELYQKCVKKAGEDSARVEACDSYLKAADALK
jgi:hypothetical protein